MSLRSHIHQLCNEHVTMMDRTPVRSISLLDRLELAFKPNAAGGASGGGKMKIPIDAGAMSLWQDIENEARDHQYEMGLERADLRAILLSWQTLEGEWEAFLEHVTLDWIDRVQALLEPAKPYRPNAPCPACGLLFHGEERAQCLAVYWRDELGQQMHPERWRMECAACGAEWDGGVLGAIADAMKEAA